MIMISGISIQQCFLMISSVSILIRFISKTSILFILAKLWRSVEDRCYVYQSYRVPQFNHHFQENQLYRKISVFLNSLPSVEDSDFTTLFAGNKSSEILLHLDENQTVEDTFLSARIVWRNERSGNGSNGRRSAFVLRLRKNDKRRILRPYLQHIISVADEIEGNKKEIKLYMNMENHRLRWLSVPFTHPATIETVVMDVELKNKVRSDLDMFLKSKSFYHRLGRVWKRSYLLYGPSGSGKSSFVAAMARFLSYDVYDIDLGRIIDDSDLKTLLLQTTSKSLIVVEDLDRYLAEKSTAISLSGILSFMDGIASCCGEERVMVFTMNSKNQIDPAILRPGRIDFHIQFPPCDFSAFKSLAGGYLGLKDHKLFPQVEEVFQKGGSLTPAEIGEIMISNRSSPSRALKSVITALQSSGGDGREGSTIGERLSETKSVRSGAEAVEPSGVFCRESVHTVREFGKLYGLLRMGSRSKAEPSDLSPVEKDGDLRHD